MPDSLTPVIREEEFLSAIAGESTMPTPVIRREEFLAEIGNRVDGLANDVEDLADIVPTPEAADSGKVLTAGADGTASWQTASGGGGGACWEVTWNEGYTVLTLAHSYNDIMAAIAAGNYPTVYYQGDDGLYFYTLTSVESYESPATEFYATFGDKNGTALQDNVILYAASPTVNMTTNVPNQ